MKVLALLAALLLAAASARAETVLRIAPGSDVTGLDPMGPAGTQTYIRPGEAGVAAAFVRKADKRDSLSNDPAVCRQAAPGTRFDDTP